MALLELLSNVGHEVLASLELACEVGVVASRLCLGRFEIGYEVSVVASDFLRCFDLFGQLCVFVDHLRLISLELIDPLSNIFEFACYQLDPLC